MGVIVKNQHICCQHCTLVVPSRGRLSIFLTLGQRLSARPNEKDYADKSFVAERTDGGKIFPCTSRIVPRDGPYRAVMPPPARLEDGYPAVALRRGIPGGDDICWMDCYRRQFS